MKFHVFRYLSKPLDKNRLYRNMSDALYQINMDTKPVLIETSGESVMRYADELIMIESDKRGSIVHAVDQVYAATQPMKYWESLLEIGSFYRTHRSFIVNMKYVRSFTSNLITLKSPKQQDLSAYLTRRRYADFKNTYIRYLEAMK